MQMFPYCSKGEDLRQEYLDVLNELVKALKEHGKFNPKTKFVAERSEIARQAWEKHSRSCIACYGRIKFLSPVH
jgi:hypothetical protein